MKYKSISTEYENVASAANIEALDGWRVHTCLPHYSKNGWAFVLFCREAA